MLRTGSPTPRASSPASAPLPPVPDPGFSLHIQNGAGPKTLMWYSYLMHGWRPSAGLHLFSLSVISRHPFTNPPVCRARAPPPPHLAQNIPRISSGKGYLRDMHDPCTASLCMCASCTAPRSQNTAMAHPTTSKCDLGCPPYAGLRLRPAPAF